MYFKIKLMSLDLWENWNESCCYWSWTWGIKHIDEYIQLGYNVIICDRSKENINNYITILGFHAC